MAHLSNYYTWVLSLFEPYLGRRIWDAGAGVGNITAELLKRADCVLATEYEPDYLPRLKHRFRQEPRLEVRYCDLKAPDTDLLRSFALDTVISLDVIEHLDDDRVALNAFFDSLTPGGHLLLKVPAHPFLYSPIDAASGHYRRYLKRQLADVITGAGFEPLHLRHMNFAGVLPYLVKGKFLHKEQNFSVSLNRRRLDFYNRLMPWLQRLEQVIRLPIGLSLVAVARKPLRVA